MPIPQDSDKKEQPSTYFVQDRHNEEELTRLTIQDRMLTAGMGGVLSEQPDPTAFHRILDVGCGSGSWVIDAAQAYPTMSLVGIDISKRMVDYARTQAQAHQVSDRVEFHVMDALLLLEFPPAYFDMVNLRLGISWIRTWDWPKLLSEMQRVTRPGGVIRLTDSEVLQQSNSPAIMQLSTMFLCAFYRAGHIFEEETTGLTAHLARLLTRHGCQQVQTQARALEFRAGTAEWQGFYEDTMHMFKTLRPFFRKWGCASKDYDALYNQALEEMQMSTFRSTWNFLTAWGIRP